jgi:uncharacterized protein YycO
MKINCTFAKLFFMFFKWCILFFALFAFIQVGCHRSKQVMIPTDRLSEGDLAFRRGSGTKSQAVLYADKEGLYSHVGIIVKDGSDFMVVHITPGERYPGETVDKIKMERLEDFFARDKAKKGAILHFTDSSECSEKAAQYAKEFFEKEILFDHDYNLDDSTKMYCSEMVWRLYLKTGRDITNRKRSEIEGFPIFSGTYIFPSDIYQNQYLIIVYEF